MDDISNKNPDPCIWQTNSPLVVWVESTHAAHQPEKSNHISTDDVTAFDVQTGNGNSTAATCNLTITDFGEPYWLLARH